MYKKNSWTLEEIVIVIKLHYLFWKYHRIDTEGCKRLAEESWGRIIMSQVPRENLHKLFILVPLCAKYKGNKLRRNFS